MGNELIILSEDLFLGKGSHKKCYKYPKESNKCIKIPYTIPGKKDLERELTYLKVLQRKNKNYSVLPHYFGHTETNLGTGHIYELITDYDGSPSKTLEDYCKNNSLLEKDFNLLVMLLKELKQNLLDNEIITMGIWPENIIVQYGGADSTDYKLRIINDMGSAALIPLEYYFSFVAKKRINKRWSRFTDTLKEHYGSPLVNKLAEQIK